MTIRIIRMMLALIFGAMIPASAAAQDVAPEISPIAGNLYRLRDGDRQTVVLATTGGVVVVDPLSIATSRWLKEELARRFSPDVVRFVLHTSHRVERSEGAATFNATAELVGQRGYNAELSRERGSPPRPLPPGDETARLLKDKDRNGDGRLTGDELYRYVLGVERNFDDRLAIAIGGRTVEMVHAAIPGEPDNAIVVFPVERVGFAATAPAIDTAPFTFGDFTPHEMQDWLTAVTSAPFDVLLVADGRTIRRDQLVKASTYVDDLITRVAAEYESGTSAARFGDTKVLPTVKSDPMFGDWRGNVADVYRDVSVFRMDATIGALGSYVLRDDVYCQSFTTCSSGGLVTAGTGSLSATYQRFALVGEVTASEEAFSSRTSRLYDDEFALRETRVAVMAGYKAPAGFASYRLLGGMSYAVAYRSGVYRIKEGLATFAGRRPLESRDVRWGLTGGVDLVMGHRIGLVIPLRVNYAVEAAKATWPSRFDAQAGVALTLRLRRKID